MDGSEADLEQGRGRRSSSLYDAGRNQSEAHLVGDASDSEDEEGRRRRSSASARAPSGSAAPAATDSHAYPPPVSRPTSRTTSPRQIDTSDKKAAAADYGAVLGSPPLSPTQQPSIDALRVKAGAAFNEAPTDEPDAWDAWDDGEDATPTEMPPSMTASSGSLKSAAAATRKREGSSDSLKMSPTVASRKLRVD